MTRAILIVFFTAALLLPIAADTSAPGIQHLLDGHEVVARTARSAFKSAESANDQASADLVTQRIHVHEKAAWMKSPGIDR